jgi:hypothetical protein
MKLLLALLLLAGTVAGQQFTVTTNQWVFIVWGKTNVGWHAEKSADGTNWIRIPNVAAGQTNNYAQDAIPTNTTRYRIVP